MIEPILAITALAFLSESLTEYLFAAPLSAARLPADLVRYIAVAVGVLLAWTYNVDMTRELLGLTPRPAALGVVLSGVMMGRGASYVHDFYQSYLRPSGDKVTTSGT